jgi:hypothetical protein
VKTGYCEGHTSGSNTSKVEVIGKGSPHSRKGILILEFCAEFALLLFFCSLLFHMNLLVYKRFIFFSLASLLSLLLLER